MLGFDPRAAKIVWTVVLIALLLYIAYLIRTTLLVVIFSVFFSYLLHPLIQFAERHKSSRLPRSAAVAAVFVVVIGIASIAGILFGAQIADEAVRLGQQLPQLLQPANLSRHFPLPATIEPLWTRALNLLQGRLPSGPGETLPLLQRAGASLIHAVSNLFYLAIVPILSFFLITEAPMLQKQVLTLLGESRRTLWIDILEDLHLLFAGYMRALLLLSLATLTSYSLVLSMLDVPYALFFAGLAAVLEFIPVFGPLVSVGAALIISAVSGYPHLLWLVAFFVVYRIFQDYMLNPFLMSGEAKVSPLLVIIGLLAGEQIAGVAGIFLSVPVLAALKIVLRRTHVLARPARKNLPPQQ